MAYILREIEGDTHTVILKYAALDYYLGWIAIVLTFLSAITKEQSIYIVTCIAWVILFGIVAPMWPTLWKLIKQKKEGILKASGSIWSFSNPPRFEWKE